MAVGRYSRGAAPQKAQMGTYWVVEIEKKNQLFVWSARSGPGCDLQEAWINKAI
jgi:hypothetical protein